MLHVCCRSDHPDRKCAAALFAPPVHIFQARVCFFFFFNQMDMVVSAGGKKTETEKINIGGTDRGRLAAVKEENPLLTEFSHLDIF